MIHKVFLGNKLDYYEISSMKKYARKQATGYIANATGIKPEELDKMSDTNFNEYLYTTLHNLEMAHKIMTAEEQIEILDAQGFDAFVAHQYSHF